MLPDEIRAKIDCNNKKIKECFNASQFTLNKEIETYIKLNEDLRQICIHEFVDGICKWCDEIGEIK